MIQNTDAQIAGREDHGSRAHAREGPSSLKTFDLCPWFEDKREGQNEDAANEGQLLHETVEVAVKNILRLGLRAASFGDIVAREDVWGDADLDEEQKLIAANCVREVHKVMQSHVEHRPHLEMRINVADMTWGTADFVLVAGAVGYVYDWKFGERLVSHPRCNLQVYAYVLGVFHAFPEVQFVTGGIMQPRIDDEIAEFTFVRAQCEFMLKRIATIIARRRAALDGSLPDDRQVSSACEFCTAKLECPRFGGWVGETIEAVEDDELSEIEWPEGFDTPEERGEVFAAVKLIESWAKLYTRRLYDLGRDGLEFEGFIPIHKGGVKTIPAEKRIAAVEAAIKALDPELAGIMSRRLGTTVYNKLLSAMDLTLGKLPSKSALAVVPLLKIGDPIFYLKKR